MDSSPAVAGQQNIGKLAADAGKVQVLAFANFGTALRSSADSAKGNSNAILDYSKQDLSISSEAREKVNGSCWIQHCTLIVRICNCSVSCLAF